MTMQLQRVTSAEIAALRQISIETFTATFGSQNTPANLRAYLARAYSEAQLTRELNQPGTTFELMLVDHQLAGYLKLNVGAAQSESMGADALEVERIYVKQAFKRQGLGTALITHALQVAQQGGQRTVWLGVWEHNDAAQAFYAHMGFEAVSDHVFQLGDDVQRDIIMSRSV